VAVQHKLTTKEFLEFCERPENSGRIFELIEGEVVEKMPSFVPSEIGVTIGYYIKGYVLEHPIGYVAGADGGYLMPNGDVYNPDVGYISKEHLPEKPARAAPVPPDMAVEVKTPTDDKRTMRRKADKSLEAGTRLIWLVFPDEHIVEVYLPDQDVQTVEIEGTLDGSDVLPGFKLAVKDIFAR
jgi:Uma2 family endonuclease